MNLEELKKEYANQDNRAAAYPIYVTVQELVCIGIMADDYDVMCPYGDGEMKTRYKHHEFEGTYETENELIEVIRNECPGKKESDAMITDIEELNLGYIWHPVEFFLTIKGAKEYMKANAHNHGKLRTYVDYFERRNFEMRGLLKDVGFKIND